MPEKSDKELTTELVVAWLDANARGGQAKLFSMGQVQDAFTHIYNTVSSADSK